MSDIEKMLIEYATWHKLEDEREDSVRAAIIAEFERLKLQNDHLRRVNTEHVSKLLYDAALAERDARIAELTDKAIRFDLDQAGIESRERDAVELVEARARIAELEAADASCDGDRFRWLLRHCIAAVFINGDRVALQRSSIDAAREGK